MKYIAKTDGALPGGRFYATKVYSESQLKSMNRGEALPDKEYMKSNFVEQGKGVKVDDPGKKEEYKRILMSRQIPFKKNASEKTLKKMVDNSSALDTKGKDNII